MILAADCRRCGSWTGSLHDGLCGLCWDGEQAKLAAQPIMSGAVARDALEAVLLFFDGGPWTYERVQEWMRLTGQLEATPAALCDVVRRALAGLEPEDIAELARRKG